jgi:hypothetical protein
MAGGWGIVCSKRALAVEHSRWQRPTGWMKTMADEPRIPTQAETERATSMLAFFMRHMQQTSGLYTMAEWMQVASIAMVNCASRISEAPSEETVTVDTGELSLVLGWLMTLQGSIARAVDEGAAPPGLPPLVS